MAIIQNQLLCETTNRDGADTFIGVGATIEEYHDSRACVVVRARRLGHSERTTIAL